MTFYSKVHVEYLTTSVVYILAFFCFISPPVVHIAQLIILLILVLDWRYSINIIQSLFGKIFLIFVPVSLISAIWASNTFGFTDSQFEQALDYIHMSLFIAVGWAMFRQKINLTKLFAVLVVGLLVSLIIHMPSEGYGPLLSGGSHRLRIESIHPIQLGAYTAALATGLVVWLVWSIFSSVNSLRHWLVNIILLIALLTLLTVLLLTWSRGPWLGFMLSILFVIGFKLILMLRIGKMRVNHIITPLALAIACISIVGVLGSDKIIQRITREQVIYQRILSGEIEDLPKTSIGWRVHMNVFAWKKFWERPLFGWGPYIKHVIDSSDQGFRWGHLHNSYWEVLLRFGIVGGILFGVGIIWLLRGLWLDYKNHPEQEPVLLGLYGAFVVLAVWALIDYKFTGWENTAFIWLLGGAAASRALRAKFESSI